MLSKQRHHSFVLLAYTIASVSAICMPIFKNITYIDEFVTLILFVFGFRFSKKKSWFGFYASLFGLCLYLLYSIFFGKNIAKAVFLDFILFLKPLICFFIAYLHPFSVSELQQNLLKKLYGILGVFCIVQVPFLDLIYTNTASYYGCCIICVLSYLYYSKQNKFDIIFSIVVLSAGLLSFRAKFYTEYIFFLFVLVALRNKIKINIKWLILSVAIMSLAIYVSWEKFVLYFINGVNDGVARSLFYKHIPDVLLDNIPFGSGFGSYNTEAAAKFYSPLYRQYGMDYVWGLRAVDYKTSHDYLRDTFYPALAQFGFFGIIVYILFWMRTWSLSQKLNLNYYKVFILIFFVELVENLANNAFTSATGVVYLMLLGMVLSQIDLGHQNQGRNNYEHS